MDRFESAEPSEGQQRALDDTDWPGTIESETDMHMQDLEPMRDYPAEAASAASKGMASDQYASYRRLNSSRCALMFISECCPV